MDSIQTKSHSDGTYSYDPSWRHSESGTRLGVLDDVWIYRKGMIALDALQLVALEEHIITDEREYPEGEKFWEAIEALRERGAHIPTFEASASYDGESRSSTTDAEVDEEKIATHLNYGKPVRSHVHRYDRDYQERLALKVAPILAEAAETLDLSPAVAYRAAEAYAAGHAAGMVQGASHETTIGAALRIASIEAGTPRPLKTVASVLDISQKSTRRKFTRLIQDTNISGAIDNSDLVPEPTDYVPYMARQLGIHDDEAIQTQVRELLAEAEVGSGASPMSEVGAAFYTVLKAAPEHSYTQTQVGDAAGVSAVTIRNNYKKFGELL